MGNYFCQKDDTPLHEKPSPRTSIKGQSTLKKLLIINRRFLDKCDSEYIKYFHEEIVQADILELFKQMRQQELSIKKNGNYPTEEEIYQIYKGLIQDLQQKGKHLYNQLLIHYSQFIIQLFELNDMPLTKAISAYNQGDVRTSISLVKNQAIKRSISENKNPPQKHQKDIEHNQQILRQFQENKLLSQQLIDQLSCMFQLLQQILEYLYGSYIQSIFGSDIDSYMDRVLLLQRIYQKDLLKINGQMQFIISSALMNLFQYKSELVKSEHLSPAVLDPTLIPKETDSILHDEFLLLDSIEQKLIQESPLQGHTQNFPYSQTFFTLEKIINCRMPWLKFKLIGKLDKQIVEIFLKQRSMSQIAQFNEVIKPEDAKIEVLVYILQKYMCYNPSKNLILCYYELRWMLEDEAVIPEKLKSIFCPYFCRFISIYEMAYRGYLKRSSLRQFIG